MSVVLYGKRSGIDMLGMLDTGEVDALNAALATHGTGVFIDPYGDTKLIASHIDRILTLPDRALSRETRAVFEGLGRRSVVYAVGH